MLPVRLEEARRNPTEALGHVDSAGYYHLLKETELLMMSMNLQVETVPSTLRMNLRHVGYNRWFDSWIVT